MKNPPPPEVGNVFRGPPIGHGHPQFSGKTGLYYVRAVVDVEEVSEDGWSYQVVFRFFTRNKGWRYVIEDAYAFGYEKYKKINKRRPRKV